MLSSNLLAVVESAVADTASGKSKISHLKCDRWWH